MMTVAPLASLAPLAETSAILVMTLAPFEGCLGTLGTVGQMTVAVLAVLAVFLKVRAISDMGLAVFDGGLGGLGRWVG